MTGAPARSRVDWHGRRRGRRLRPYRQDLIAELLPRLRVALPAAGDLLDVAGLFPQPPSQLWLEVGFGSGEHLAEQARRHPEVGFIGCEVFVNGVAALIGQVERLELANVRSSMMTPPPIGCLARSIGRSGLSVISTLGEDAPRQRRFIGPSNLATLAASCRRRYAGYDDAGYVR
jgi:tRNA (guanine-N7-)-methyltransferase